MKDSNTLAPVLGAFRKARIAYLIVATIFEHGFTTITPLYAIFRWNLIPRKVLHPKTCVKVLILHEIKPLINIVPKISGLRTLTPTLSKKYTTKESSLKASALPSS